MPHPGLEVASPNFKSEIAHIHEKFVKKNLKNWFHCYCHQRMLLSRELVGKKLLDHIYWNILKFMQKFYQVNHI